MSSQSPATPGTQRALTALDLIRTLILIVALFSVGLWGVAAWPLPLNIVFGIGLPLAVLVVWALFLSPRQVLALHPFLRAAVELLLYVGVTLAWWAMGQGWVGLVFAVIAVTAGVIAGRRALS